LARKKGHKTSKNSANIPRGVTFGEGEVPLSKFNLGGGGHATNFRSKEDGRGNRGKRFAQGEGRTTGIPIHGKGKKKMK